MAVMTAESHVPTSYLLEDFLSLDTPEGYRAELISGEIVVTPPPDGNHEDIIGHIIKQVLRNSTLEMDFSGHKGLIIPARGVHPANHVIPDATFASAELRLFRGAAPWMSATRVAMVAEVTSQRAGLDRNEKRRGYAAAGIPLYLLADRQHQRLTLFSDPQKDDYARTLAATFGESLELPKPFAFTLETAPFTD
jgi:Uma2 family endonuclease